MGPRHPVELRTDRLRLWMPRAEHAAYVLAYFVENRAHFERWSPTPRADFYTLEHWSRRLEKSIDEYQQDRALRLFVSHVAEGTSEIIGHLAITEIVRGSFQAGYLGYGLAHKVQGQGFMGEAIARALSFAFEELSLHRVMANYMPSNDRSASVLARLGFVIEGRARDYLFLHGRWQDHVLTSLTSPRPQDPPG